MQNGKLLEYGLRNFTKIEMPSVLDAIYQDAAALIKQEQPKVVVLERPVHFKNANSVLALVGAYSMVTLAALHCGVALDAVRPSELKRQTGKGNADKETVALDVAMRFCLDFDSVAIPVLYKVNDRKGKYKAGDLKERLYDPADAIALCWAYHQKIKGAE